MQRNCQEFKEILDQAFEQKGDWRSVERKPETRDFLKHKKYRYLEANGDTVHLSIDNGFWVDNFKDGTYSKLKFNWVNNCEFDIVFVESNNQIRKNFSTQGDKYRYQIISKSETFYFMSVEIPETGRHMTFKIYY